MIEELDMLVFSLAIQAAFYWKYIAVGLLLLIAGTLLLAHIFQPKKYKAVMHLNRPLGDIQPGWYEVTFYSDGVRDLGPTED